MTYMTYDYIWFLFLVLCLHQLLWDLRNIANVDVDQQIFTKLSLMAPRNLQVSRNPLKTLLMKTAQMTDRKVIAACMNQIWTGCTVKVPHSLTHSNYLTDLLSLTHTDTHTHTHTHLPDWHDDGMIIINCYSFVFCIKVSSWKQQFCSCLLYSRKTHGCCLKLRWAMNRITNFSSYSLICLSNKC